MSSLSNFKFGNSNINQMSLGAAAAAQLGNKGSSPLGLGLDES